MFGKNNKQQGDTELFAVYDSKTESYSDIIPSINHLDIIREFTNAFQDPSAETKNRYYRNAEDFSLFKIGGYDRKTGQMQGHNPTHVVNFHELKSQVERMKSRTEQGALSST